MSTISIDDFKQVELHIGTVLTANLNVKARKAAYILEVDFGDLGIKTTSAQLTENYTAEELIGLQVTAILNFPSMRIAGIKSEILVLGAVCNSNGTVLLTPSKVVQNGTMIA